MTDTDDTIGNDPGTTHAEWGAGHPHLLITGGGERRRHELVDDTTRIGSSAENELALPETDAHHATIEHDDRDEYVLILHGAGEMNANPTKVGDHREGTEILRTGARFTAGPWSLVFIREEFADHGRPHGGREGGELSDQPPQPARPDYAAPGDEESPRPLEVQND